MKTIQKFNFPFALVWGGLALLWLVLIAALAPVAHADTDVVTAVKISSRYIYAQQKKHPFEKGAVLSTGECIAGIAFSRNPAGAAAVGVPVLVVGNLSAYILRKKGHPTVAKYIQDGSGMFCMAYGLTRPGRHIRVTKPSGGGNGGNGGGSGGGGNGGGSGGGGNGGGSGNGGGGNGGGGNGGGCQQDCGLPGNGGVNGGHDGNKPPFPGDPHRPGA